MTPTFRAFIRRYHEETVRLFDPRPIEPPRQSFIRETQRLDSIHDAYCESELGFYPYQYYSNHVPLGEEGTWGGRARAREGLATLEADLAEVKVLMAGKHVIVRNLLIPPAVESKPEVY